MNQAALAITSELALHTVLQQIVDSLREMTGAEYAALGVPNSAGLLDEFIYSGMPLADVAGIPHLLHGLGLLGAMIKERKRFAFPALVMAPARLVFQKDIPQ